jgi:hypothetical protein
LRSGKKEASNENQPPNSWEQMQKTREQKSNLACNENKHRATKKKHNGGKVRDGAMVAQQQQQQQQQLLTKPQELQIRNGASKT